MLLRKREPFTGVTETTRYAHKCCCHCGRRCLVLLRSQYGLTGAVAISIEDYCCRQDQKYAHWCCHHCGRRLLVLLRPQYVLTCITVIVADVHYCGRDRNAYRCCCNSRRQSRPTKIHVKHIFMWSIIVKIIYITFTANDRLSKKTVIRTPQFPIVSLTYYNCNNNPTNHYWTNSQNRSNSEITIISVKRTKRPKLIDDHSHLPQSWQHETYTHRDEIMYLWDINVESSTLQNVFCNHKMPVPKII